MNGYGSQCSIQAMTFSIIHSARITDCVMMKPHEPIVAATVSATRWPAVRCAACAVCQFLRVFVMGAGLLPNQPNSKPRNSTICVAPHRSAFRGKADMAFLRRKSPLMTQSGHRAVLHFICALMNEADIADMRCHLTAILCVGPKVSRYDASSEPPGGGNEAARLHQAFGCRGGNVAPCGACATADHAGNRIPQQPIAQHVLREQST